ncbi:MAG: 1-aminocyclopropane-1-carboxylate deaminase [Alteromonadaceae bacterium]|jgi:1-aminocyclopropane-1-carboxylate deaminase
MKLAQTPVDMIKLNGFTFYLKRDDLLHPDFCGNKARKFYSLLGQDLSGFNKLISYGSPQANSLHSLAVLARMKGVKFDYYVSHIASFVTDHPAGNYRAALANGARVIVVDKEARQQRSMADFINEQVAPNEPASITIPEGGHYAEAEMGIKLLADEIIGWAQGKNINQLKLALPSGTGTTALFLQRHFLQQQDLQIEVLTCACVGGDDYLRQQFFMLEANAHFHPQILPSASKHHFGKLYLKDYQLWQQLSSQTGVEFELLYDPHGWQTLLDYLAGLETEQQAIPVMYIHQGGLLGNETLLPRYKRKWPTS